MSESGIIDAFFMMGPTPLDVFKQYANLSGATPLPQVQLLLIIYRIYFITIVCIKVFISRALL